MGHVLLCLHYSIYGGFSLPLCDKEMGAFSTQCIKKEKKKKPLQHFLDILTLLWFAKQVPWQPIVRKRLGEPGKAVLFVIVGQGFLLGPEPPNTAGGLAYFHRSRSCQSGAQKSIRSWCREAAWSEQDTDGWESAGKGKGHVGWKNWSGWNREQEMEFLLDTLIGFPWVNSNAITVATLIVRFYEML